MNNISRENKYNSKFLLLGIIGIIVVAAVFGIKEKKYFSGSNALSAFLLPELSLKIEKQSGFEVIVNGYSGPFTAGVKRLVWDWGDGAKGEGWFPQSHTYSRDGRYTIRVISQGLFGDATSSLDIDVGVKPPTVSAPTEITAPQPVAKLMLNAPKKSGLAVEVNGYVENAEKLIWNWGDGTAETISWFPATHTYTQDGIYKITVKAVGGDKTIYKTVTANIISCEDKFVTKQGKYSGFFNFPKCFFDESVVPVQQILRVTDALFLSLQTMHNGIKPYDFTKIVYDPPVNGQTRVDGIALGDPAFPGLHAGNPPWHVMAHEQGHNFFGGTSAFYGVLAFGYPFLQESLAGIDAFYSYHHILNNSSAFLLTASTLESLTYDFGGWRSFYESQYNTYVANGSAFKLDEPVGETFTSSTLLYKMILYGETYGWENYTKLAKAFENGIASQFKFQNDGASATEQSTYIIAALGVAFQKDFRGEFKALNFPVDDTLYGEIYPKIASYVVGAGIAPPAPIPSPVPLLPSTPTPTPPSPVPLEISKEEKNRQSQIQYLTNWIETLSNRLKNLLR